jgi:hypothetical protein
VRLLVFGEIFVLRYRFNFGKDLVLGVGDFEELMDKFLEPFVLGVHLRKTKVNSLMISLSEELLFSFLPFDHFGSEQVMFFGIEFV